MSYEGHTQWICRRGHRFDSQDSFDSEEDRCDVCGAESAWGNQVDDTNGESDGVINDWSSLLIEPAEVETCNLGHDHIIKHARYRPPTVDEAHELRLYWDGTSFHRLWEGPRAAQEDHDEGPE